MKKISCFKMLINIVIMILLSFFSRASLALTCPDFNGVFSEQNSAPLHIQQTKCTSLVFQVNDKKTFLILDGQIRLHEKGLQNISFVKSYIQKNNLVIEQMIQPLSAGPNFSSKQIIYKSILTYFFTSPKVLVEDTKLYNGSGTFLDSNSIELNRVN